MEETQELPMRDHWLYLSLGICGCAGLFLLLQPFQGNIQESLHGLAALLVVVGAVAALVGVTIRPVSPAREQATPEFPDQPTRAAPLDNKPWLSLAEECVSLVDEMDRQREHFDSARQELCDHIISRLVEILER